MATNTGAGYNTASGGDPYTIPTTKPTGTGVGTGAATGAQADPYAGNTGTTGTTTGSATTTGHGTNPVKNILAGIHGAGEKLRGEINGWVDSAAGEQEGVQKNAAIANAGDAEMQTGQFSTGTKNREGAVPGDGGRRHL